MSLKQILPHGAVLPATEDICCTWLGKEEEAMGDSNCSPLLSRPQPTSVSTLFRSPQQEEKREYLHCTSSGFSGKTK